MVTISLHVASQNAPKSRLGVGAVLKGPGVFSGGSSARLGRKLRRLRPDFGLQRVGAA